MKGGVLIFAFAALSFFSALAGDLAFTDQPASQSALANDTVTFFSKATSSLPITYQWFKGTIAIPGASHNYYSFQVFDQSDGGLYRVRAQTSAETVFSNDAELKVYPRPLLSIIAPTNGANLPGGQPQVLEASVPSALAAIVTNVAFVNGSDVLGSMSSAPYRLAVQLPVGNYTLRAIAKTSWGASDTSAPVAFGVSSTQIKASRQPLSQEVLLGRTVQFRGDAEGTVAVTYQWLKDGGVIPGATNAGISIAVTNLNQAGSYRLRITSEFESIETDPATLVVHAAPPDWASLFWRPFPESPGGLFHGIACGNGVTIAAGDRHLVASTDGITWTEVSPPFFDSLTRIRFLNGRFWVTANAGILWSSADGLNWSRIVTGVSYGLADITYDRGLYVAVPATGQKPIYSADGATWTQSATLFRQGAAGVTAGNGLFVAALGFSSGKAAVSTNAIDWSITTIDTVGDSTDITFFKNQFVAIRSNGIFTSADGVSWQKRLAAFEYICAVTNQSELFAIGGKVARSTDGTNFTVTSAFIGFNLTAAVFTGSAYFATSSSRLAGALNPLSWNLLGSAAPPVHFPPRVNFANGNFFIPGRGIAYDDGSGDWSKRLTMYDVPVDADFSGVAFGGGIYIAANGNAAPTGYQMWKAGANMIFTPFAGASQLSRIIFTDGEFLGVGANYYAFRSPDGNHWYAISPSGGFNRLYAITKANGNAIAAGANGKAYLSENGGAWNEVQTGTTGLIEGAAYGEGLFVLVGNGSLQYSTDGAAWVAAKKFFSTELTDVAYGDGIFLATGNGGTLAYSWDGINWEQSQLHIAEDLFGIAYGNNRWVLESRGGTLLQTGPRRALTPVTLSISLNATTAEVTFNATPSRILRIETSSNLTDWTLSERLLVPNERLIRNVPISSSSQLYIRAILE